MSQPSLPESEIDRVVRLIAAHPEYASTPSVQRAYTALGLEVFSDPFGKEVPERIAAALRARQPLAVVRIGDGEANILSWGIDRETPALDRFCVARILDMQGDRFVSADAWMLALREMLLAALLQADIVGVVGLWRSRPAETEGLTSGEIKELVRRYTRAASGSWRAIDHMLRLARQGHLRNKTVASKHLYFGVLRHLPYLCDQTERILLISDRPDAMDRLQRRYPRHCVDRIVVGSASASALTAPEFLAETEAALPADLTGCLCLVGAGPWAEIYCGWIKQRGGVGVDIGSGFDLVEDKITRPVHRNLGLDKSNEYAL